MIKLHSPLEIKPDPRGGWQLVFWTGNAFDYTTSFRALLDDITQALGQEAQHDLQLPPYEVGEDFVEGTLRFGSSSLRIYYEHSLSYLALMCDSARVLQDVADRLRASVQVV
ncbi:hypothetical protein H8A95_33440 [Bradyrhizobium sp. Pear76]|uniref:hypothetical protein n=1 Tax=Bradyrhizobium oropedii TaxID=1571201 RepID=UPI001E59E613|nr:hypothetical protein [Bradyrhizobium oropedii]MCC8967104.1 hypothetical protein [Bradyrhizobium oropedii]